MAGFSLATGFHASKFYGSGLGVTASSEPQVVVVGARMFGKKREKAMTLKAHYYTKQNTPDLSDSCWSSDGDGDGDSDRKGMGRRKGRGKGKGKGSWDQLRSEIL